MIRLRPTATMVGLSIVAGGDPFGPYTKGVFIISEGDEVPEGCYTQEAWITSEYYHLPHAQNNWQLEEDTSIVPRRVKLLYREKGGLVGFYPLAPKHNLTDRYSEAGYMVHALEGAWLFAERMSTAMVEAWQTIKERSIGRWQKE